MLRQTPQHFNKEETEKHINVSSRSQGGSLQTLSTLLDQQGDG